MPKLKIQDLKTLNTTTIARLFAEEPDAMQIALHEAAHVVAAISHNVHVLRVWVKTTAGSGMTILTRGDEGHAIVTPNDEHQNCFISLVGVAWEERHGTPRLALHDAQKFNFSRPWVLDHAREFVIKEHRSIEACAAAILGLRDRHGWLQGGRLVALCNWLRPQVVKRQSVYELGTLSAHEPWVTQSPFRVTVETYLNADDSANAKPRIRVPGPVDISLQCSTTKASHYPLGSRFSLDVQLLKDEQNAAYLREIPGAQWAEVVEAKVICKFTAPPDDVLSSLKRKRLH